jgi:hypothetical protein
MCDDVLRTIDFGAVARCGYTDKPKVYRSGDLLSGESEALPWQG